MELSGLTRTHMKRKLLDHLAANHDFAVPPSMVDAEFDQIWQQLEHEASHDADPEKAKKELEKDRDEYRRIDRKSGVSGKSGSVRVDLGGRRILKKKKSKKEKRKI